MASILSVQHSCMRWQVQKGLLSLESFRVPRIGGSQGGEPRNRRANATYLEMLQAQAVSRASKACRSCEAAPESRNRFRLTR